MLIRLFAKNFFLFLFPRRMSQILTVYLGIFIWKLFLVQNSFVLCRSGKKASVAEVQRGKGRLVIGDDGQIVQGSLEYCYLPFTLVKRMPN